MRTAALAPLTLAACLALFACDKPPPAQAEAPPRPVRVQAVAFTEPRTTLTYSGTVQARRQADLAFRVGGKIVARSVDLGVRVHAGDVLARLDPADLTLAAEAAQNAMAAAAADATNARLEFQRYENLGRKSPSFLASEREKRVAANVMANARLAQAQRQYALALSQQNYGTLYADTDGVVVALPAEIGQVVAAGQTVMTLAQTAETEVLIDLPENRLPELRAADEIAIVPWSDPSRSLAGQIREVAARADPASRTFAVRIALRDADEQLALGGTATVRLTGRGVGPVAVLPAAALGDCGGSPCVWVLDEPRGHVSPRPVKVAAFQGDQVAIASGLQSGEQVVTAGVTQLDPALSVVAWAGAQR